jgi:hypothetical protein
MLRLPHKNKVWGNIIQFTKSYKVTGLENWCTNSTLFLLSLSIQYIWFTQIFVLKKDSCLVVCFLILKVYLKVEILYLLNP